MPKEPAHLHEIRQRHARVAAAYDYMTKAENDRAALLVEVDRMRAKDQRLQQLVEELRRDGVTMVSVEVLAGLVIDGERAAT